METYILRLDNVGRKTIQRLQDAVRRGVQVCLMYDSAGSTSVPILFDSGLHSLRASGAQIIEFNPIFPLPWRRRTHHIFHRNHRKILLVDDTVAFCGGMNIADEYCGVEMGGTGLFHDTQVRIEGPAVAHFASVVSDSMREASWDESPRNTTCKQLCFPREDEGVSELREVGGLLGNKNEDNGVCVQVLAANSWRNMRQLQRTLRLTIKFSTNRCYITSPYFLPPPSLLRAMISAAKRGVDVRVITSGVACDVPMAHLASRYIYNKLLKNGVRIYEYEAATLHSKSVCVDAVYCFWGSFNFDLWSYSRNLEVGIGVLDAELCKRVEREFVDNLGKSKEVTKEDIVKSSLLQKGIQFILYMGYTFMMRF
eukprot:CAMPEP_0184496952 /NCGR_PEP_ID=MMETSP0113_2-20130426/35318_1 /TAXON_ID=91329 /ORGANISM="Norrisiella sphaerica, Strain BC52" /LENGTH=367 /DNA_ID=CAMNT_0026883841 /DNA_START=551 /DNA_END=1654 /DNA_ORIENTATION=+